MTTQGCNLWQLGGLYFDFQSTSLMRVISVLPHFFWLLTNHGPSCAVENIRTSQSQRRSSRANKAVSTKELPQSSLGKQASLVSLCCWSTFYVIQVQIILLWQSILSFYFLIKCKKIRKLKFRHYPNNIGIHHWGQLLPWQLWKPGNR